MENVIQDPHDLELGIFDRPLLPDVALFKHEEAIVEDYLVGFSIIGESHIVQIYLGGIFIHAEILACIPINPLDCLGYHHLKGGGLVAKIGKGFKVSVALTQNHIPKLVFEDHIDYEFPLTFGVIPITRVEWLVGKDSIYWKTLHVYPNGDGSYTSVTSNTSVTLSKLSERKQLCY